MKQTKHCKRALALLLAMMMTMSIFAGCAKKEEPAPQTEPETVTTPEQPAEQPEEPAQEETEEPAEEPVEEPAASAHEGTWTFTDSLGREVTFEGPLTRVAPSGKLAQQCIYALNPEVIIGLTNELTGGEMKYYPESFAELPIFGTFYGKKANFNRETVLAAEPQVVLDIGQVKKNMEEDLNTLQEQLGIPVIFVEADLQNMDKAFEMLGELFEMPEEAKVLADYCVATIADVQEKAATIPEENRKTVYYGCQDTGLSTAAKGDLHAEVIDLVGGNNVVPSDLGRSFVDVDMERLLDWNPDVVIFAPNSVYAQAGEDEVWQKLPAIANGNYYEVPGMPYSWVDMPPAANRLIGTKWLGNLLYPEVYDYDMVKETQTFYDLFYHVSLTEEDAQALLANSTFKA